MVFYYLILSTMNCRQILQHFCICLKTFQHISASVYARMPAREWTKGWQISNADKVDLPVSPHGNSIICTSLILMPPAPPKQTQEQRESQYQLASQPAQPCLKRQASLDLVSGHAAYGKMTLLGRGHIYWKVEEWFSKINQATVMAVLHPLY